MQTQIGEGGGVSTKGPDLAGWRYSAFRGTIISYLSGLALVFRKIMKKTIQLE